MELRPAAPHQLGHREVDALRGLVRAFAHDDLIGIRGRDDVRRERHGIAAGPVGIATAVEALVMGVDDRDEIAERLDRREDRPAEGRVGLHDHPLLRGERGRLVENGVGNADLADVVQQRRELDPADLIRRELHLDRDDPRQGRDPGRVAPGVRIARVDRGGERLHRREVELAQSSVMLGVLERRRDDVGERLEDRDVLGVEGRAPVRLRRDDADDRPADLQRDVHRGLAPPVLITVRLAALLDGIGAATRDERLATEHDLARRTSAERQEELALADRAPVDLDEEVEEPPLRVVAGEIEGVELDEPPGRLVGEVRDLVGIVHERGRGSDLVQRREALDAALAVTTCRDTPQRGASELGQIDEALLVDHVESPMRVRRADHEHRDHRVVHEHGDRDDRMDPRLERGMRANVAAVLARVVADRQRNAALRDLREDRAGLAVRDPLEVCRRPQTGDDPRAAVRADLGRGDILGVEAPSRLLSEARDDLVGGARGELARELLATLAELEPARVRERDGRVSGEAFERVLFGAVERPDLAATDVHDGGDLALHQDRNGDRAPQAEVEDRLRGVGELPVIVDRHGGAGRDDLADDAARGGPANADDARADAGARDDLELGPAVDIEGRVIGMHELERVPRDRREHEARIRFRRDLRRRLLEEGRPSQRSPRALLLVAIGGRHDPDHQQHETDDDPLAEDRKELELVTGREEHDLLADEAQREGDGGDEDPHAAEPELDEDRRDEDQRERDAPHVRCGRDHPEGGHEEIREHEPDRRRGETERAATRGLRGPAVDDRPEQDRESEDGNGHDDLAARGDPDTAGHEAEDPADEQQVAGHVAAQFPHPFQNGTERALGMGIRSMEAGRLPPPLGGGRSSGYRSSRGGAQMSMT